MDRVTRNAKAFSDLAEISEEFRATVSTVAKAISAGGKLLICGNGGSASTAAHIVNDCVGHMRHDRDPIDAVSLSDNASVLTALANDYDYVRIFDRQVAASGRPGDVLVAISTSGTSSNVISAAEEARKRQVTVVGLTGANGGVLKDLSDHWLWAATDDPVCAEHVHLFMLHTLVESLEESLFPDSPAWGS